MDDMNTTENAVEDDIWLRMAADAYQQSSDWFDVSVRVTVEKAMAHFSNRHAPGSKYHAESYKYRSKGFRPKTRATIRRNEAAAAVAFFSTQDMVSITAENQEDQNQVLSAAILSELLNYRLDDSIPWFTTVIGSYQNAMNTGVTISHQSWDFEEEVQEFPMMDEAGIPIMGDQADELGEPVPQMQEVRQTTTDKPMIELVALENFRISPASNWADPIGTTPYIVEMIPMFIGAIKEKMATGKWIKYEDGEIQAAAQGQYDSIRQARDGSKKADSVDVAHATTDFDTVFVHRNIIRKDGKDVIFYTLGTMLRLTEPKLLREEYLHLRRGERPYVMGSCLIEAHKVYPAGLNELTFGLQEEANDIKNQRMDNVALVMNKRYFARRNAAIDFKSLTRNVPGSVTLVDDINADIRWDSPPDVTGSSYQEQDRVSLDYDELAGAFSPGSVQSNRKLGETVGGMNLLSGEANAITEYQLRVFSETWAEPVLKQLARMEQAYETDDIVMAIAGQRASAYQKFGVSQVTDQMIQGNVNVNVNVGFGSTNPEKRVQKLTLGLQSVAAFAPQIMQGLDAKEVVTEVFGALGYKSAERFFPKISEEIEPQQPPPDPRIEVANIQAQNREQIAAAGFQNEERMAGLAAQEASLDRALKQQEITGKLQAENDRLKKELAETDMKLRVQVEEGRLMRAQSDDHTLADHRMNKYNHDNPVPKQVTEPIIEPAGQADAGQSFTQ